MRAKIISFAVAAVAMSAILKADPQASEQFDFAKINRAIKEAMDPVVAQSSIFSKFTYVIDPDLTDVSQDHYGVGMEIVGKEPWSDESFLAQTKLELSYNPTADRDAIGLSYDLQVATDTLALVRHHAQKSKVCDAKSSVAGALRVALTEDCKILPRLAEVKSFDELFVIFRDHIDSAKMAMANYQAELNKASQVVTSDLARESLESQLAEIARYLDGASKVQLARTIDGVSLVIPDFPVLGVLDMKDLSADFSPAKMRASGRIRVSMGGEIYQAIKPEILQILRDLELERDYVQPLVQMETRFWLRLMEGHVSNRNE